MPLSNELISEFVSVTADQVDVKPDGSTAYGTIVVYEEEKYVQLDGSDILTPFTSTTELEDGDRVMVLIKNHSATVTGNLTNNSASSGRVNQIRDDLIKADTVIANKIEAVEGKFGTLEAGYAEIETLKAGYAKIDQLEANDVTISGTLSAHEAVIDTLDATYAKIGALDAATANITDLNASFADFETTVTETLDAHTATIDNLDSTYIKVGELDASYMDVDFANISEAAIENLYNKWGIIQNGTFENGTFTGELVAVTIKADTLILRGKDGLYYKLNVDKDGAIPTGVTEEQLQNGLLGSKIIANTITADKINVSDLVAFNAKIGGLNLADGKIYSGVKESATNTTAGIYIGSDGQMAVGDSNNFVKFYKEDNKFKLAISADSIQFSTGSNVADAIDNLQNQIDGNISTWFYDGEPSVTNEPAKNWSSDDEKNKHLGDLYYDSETGYCYRWQLQGNVYSWVKISDTDITAALNAANEATKNVNELATRVSNAETSIESNSELIELAATKTDIQESLSGYYTKEQADAAIEVSANAITQSISNTYAKNDDLDDLAERVSDTEAQVELTSTELSAKLSSDQYYGIRKIDCDFAQSDCYDKQGIRVVSDIVNWIQNGTGDPSPTNVRPIVSGNKVSYITHCGKNLLNFDWSTNSARSGVTTANIDGGLRITSTVDGTWKYARWYTSIPLDDVGMIGTKFTLSCKAKPSADNIPAIYIGVFNANSTSALHKSSNVYGSNSLMVSFSITEAMIGEGNFLGMSVYSNSNGTGVKDDYVDYTNIQLEVGSATTYESYKGNTYTVSFGEDIYGGTFDSNSGLVTVDRAYVHFTDDMLKGITISNGAFVINTGELQRAPKGGYDCIIACDSYLPARSWTDITTVNNTTCIRASDNGLLIHDSRATTANEYRELLKSMGGIGFCYYIAEPFTIQFEPAQIAAFEGLNTIYTNITDSSIEFGHESLDGLGGASMFTMNTELNLKAGSAELAVTSDRLGEAESKLTQLAESISMLVRGENGESLMTQTENGWIFSIDNIQNTLNTLSDNVGTLQTDSNDANAKLNSLDTAVRNLGEYTGYITFDTAEDNTPRIILGKTDSPFKVVITNTDIQFKEGSTTPASISNQALNIDNAVIDNELRQGEFAWIARSNGNYGLVWKGE